MEPRQRKKAWIDSSVRLRFACKFAHCHIRPSRGFCLRGIRQMVMTGLTAGRNLELDKDNARRGTSTDQGMVCIDARIVGSGSTALSVGNFVVSDSLEDAETFCAAIANGAGALAGDAPTAAGSQGHQLSLKHVKAFCFAPHHFKLARLYARAGLAWGCRSRCRSDAPRNVVGQRLD